MYFIYLIYKAGNSKYPPWQNFRIEIHCEPIRKFANHSGISILTK